ncbi:transmembrane protein 154 [Limanda limanda]|uniref:transmembrane protein 154 n=1 Tax=Limanda limanda TaxID=27771 RepID=UPI0029C956A5|nr:transmembrane protein 154 [Limanda limanda]
MSVSRPANMRASRGKTPLLLLLLVLIALTGTALCQDDGEEAPEEEVPETDDSSLDDVDPDTPVSSTTAPEEPSPTDPDPSVDSGTEGNDGEGSGEPTPDGTGEPRGGESTAIPEEDDTLGLIIIPVLVVLVVVIIGVIVCGIFLNRKWNRNKRNQELRKEDPYLDGPSSEKVPMPMFEEDVPSVLEMEMEEMDQWMKKDGETAEDSNHTGF